MSAKQLFIASSVALSVLIGGCSAADVSGTYDNQARQKSLQLTKDKKFFISPGSYSGSYSVEGKKIIVIIDMVGGAEGTIEGNKLLFPDPPVSAAGTRLRGTWAKR